MFPWSLMVDYTPLQIGVHTIIHQFSLIRYTILLRHVFKWLSALNDRSLIDFVSDGYDENHFSKMHHYTVK